MRPLAFTVGFRGWLRANLFNSWFNSLLTVFIATAIFFGALAAGRWLLFTSDWSVITERTPLYLVGTYPKDSWA